jgi:putative proteasome-type protease
MTFCLGINVEQGLVGIADTRVLTGNECLMARKTASYQGPGFAFFVMNSGLRSLRDKILLRFEEAFAKDSAGRDRLYKVVNLYSDQVRRVAEEDRAALERAELSFNSHALIGGQMAGDSTHRLFLVIGASGFGKPILERSVTSADSMLYAFKVGLLAFDATRLCAADVGFPVDVLLYSRGSFELVEHRYNMDDLREISNWWQDRMRRSVQDLPSEWVEAAFSRLTGSSMAF